MASRGSNSPEEEAQEETPRKIPPCSICEGTMVLAYDRHGQKMCVCLDCHTSMTIPGSAWEVARAKRRSRAQHVLDRRRQGRRASDLRLES